MQSLPSVLWCSVHRVAPQKFWFTSTTFLLLNNTSTLLRSIKTCHHTAYPFTLFFLLQKLQVVPVHGNIPNLWIQGVFRSARTSCTTFGGPVWLLAVCPHAHAKNPDTYIQPYMPNESSGDSSTQPYGPMGSPRCPPWPPGTPKH